MQYAHKYALITNMIYVIYGDPVIIFSEIN